jgi:hypothetical protein
MSENASVNPYAKYLGDKSADSVLRSSSATVAHLVAKLGAAGKLETPLAAGKWTPAQIMSHMADCELAFGFRLRQTLAEENHTVQPFDQDKWAMGYKGIPAEQALAAYLALRAWNLVMVEHAPIDAGARVATHPERGAMTFQILLETLAGHDINHIEQLERFAAQA